MVLVFCRGNRPIETPESMLQSAIYDVTGMEANYLGPYKPCPTCDNVQLLIQIHTLFRLAILLRDYENLNREITIPMRSSCR